MNWDNKSWDQEDIKYSQKRNVQNKISWRMPHIIGSFYSYKINGIIEYESLGELLFYFLLELDRQTIRYYVQPVKISIKQVDDAGRINNWIHVPDVLVFRNESKPMLFQIKDSPDEVPQNAYIINRKCSSYSEENGWSYSVIYPKQMPKVVLTNLKLLSGFTRKRSYYKTLVPEIIYKINYMNNIRIIELAKSFSSQVNPLMVLPAIYHLIAIGVFKADIYLPIDENSIVSIADEIDYLNTYFIKEGVV